LDAIGTERYEPGNSHQGFPGFGLIFS